MSPTKWNRESLQSKIDGKQTERAYLDDPVAVLILYLTASVEVDGRVRFLKDVYSRDARLLEAMAEPSQIALPGAG